MNELETEHEWSNANLLKLLASLKSSIPDGEQMCSYQKGLKTIDWKKVAFPPFSPEECKNKWNKIMDQMRKLRSLTELIVEAEGVISNPLHNRKIHPQIPKKPTQPRNAYFKRHYSKFKKKHPELGVQKAFKLLFEKYDKLSDEQKAEYEEKYTQELIQYRENMINFGKQNKMRVPRVKVVKSHGRTKKDSEDEEMPSKPPV